MTSCKASDVFRDIVVILKKVSCVILFLSFAGRMAQKQSSITAAQASVLLCFTVNVSMYKR